MKEQPEPRFRNALVANLYLHGRSRVDQLIELHESPTNSGEGAFFFVTLNGALIGKGLSIDEAVAQADESLNKAEFLPGLFD